MGEDCCRSVIESMKVLGWGGHTSPSGLLCYFLCQHLGCTACNDVVAGGWIKGYLRDAIVMSGGGNLGNFDQSEAANCGFQQSFHSFPLFLLLLLLLSGTPAVACSPVLLLVKDMLCGRFMHRHSVGMQWVPRWMYLSLIARDDRSPWLDVFHIQGYNSCEEDAVYEEAWRCLQCGLECRKWFAIHVVGLYLYFRCAISKFHRAEPVSVMQRFPRPYHYFRYHRDTL